jgi:ABC-type Fe3+/spermidine/putrescine transport system ATPase subunit
MDFLQLEGINKAYPGVQAVRDFNLRVEEGEIVALLGPSGCGKTTLLRIVAGLETADTGHVSLEGQPIESIPPHRRDFGLMFQDYALFPHMNVFDNVAFGLQMRRLRADEMRQRVRDALELVGLAGFEQRDVNDLSGGEQQRVALARSLAPNPRLLMLDEPLGSLDRTLRERLMNELHSILKQVGLTALYVTHDQQEAFAIADRIVVMRDGRMIQSAPPEAVYQRPADEWVAHFLGLTNLLSGRIVSQESDCVQVESDVGILRVALNTHAPPPAGTKVTVLVHPEAATLVNDTYENDANTLHGTVETRSFRGSEYLLQVRHAGGQLMTFRVGAVGQQVPEVGEVARLRLAPEGIMLWTQDSD